MNLCNYTETSWLQRMTTYLKTYSASEIRKANNQILREKLQGFDFNTKERFLSLWYESYVVLHDKDIQLNQLATRKEYHLCVRRPFRIWRQRYQNLEALDKQVSAIRQAKLKRRLFGGIIFQYKLILENQRLANKMLSKRALATWHTRYSLQIMENTHADKIYEKNIKQGVLYAWNQHKVENHVSNLYNQQLIANFLNLWISRTRLSLNNNDAAILEDREALISNVLARWMENLSLVGDLYQQAEEYANRLAMKHAFDSWKRRTVYDEIFFEYESKIAQKCKKLVFHVWRVRSLQLKEARRFRDFMCCYKQFRKWRITCRSSRIETIKNREIAAKHFKTWNLEEKLVLLTRIKNTRLAVEVLNYWRYRRDEIEYRTNDKFLHHQLISNAKLARKYLGVWRSQFAEVNEMYREAREMYDNSILQNAFYSFIYSDDAVTKNEQTADEIWVKSKETTFFSIWKKAVVNSRKKKKNEALNLFLESKRNKLKASYFEKWKKRYLDVEELSEQANDMHIQSALILQQDCLSQWIDRFLIISRNNRLAVARIDQTVLEKTFELWRNSKFEIDDLHTESQTFLAGSDMQRLERLYRIWRMRMFKLKTKGRDADDFHKRILELRFRTIWRFWKLRTQEVRSENSFIHQKNIRASTRKLGALSVGAQKLKMQNSLPPKSAPISSVTFPDLKDTDGVHFPPDFVLETPTRARIRKSNPLTSLGRWRRSKTPGVLNFEAQNASQALSTSPSDGR